MQIIKEKLDIEETLHKRIKNTLMFLNIKEKVKKGINKVDSFGVIEVPIPPIRIIKS